MALTSHSNTGSSTGPHDAVPADADEVTADAEATQAGIHIKADGEVVVDLTADDPTPTTDITCPGCGGIIRIEQVDAELRSADMRCVDCQFQFTQRLRLPADDRRDDAARRTGTTSSQARGRFRRTRR